MPCNDYRSYVRYSDTNKEIDKKIILVKVSLNMKKRQNFIIIIKIKDIKMTFSVMHVKSIMLIKLIDYRYSP